jgi:HPt (histidine-containing phosphotransfer) domain-containing protein
MTVQEFYLQVGGDYDTALENMITEEDICRFMGMFLKDTNYKRLTEALEQKDAPRAFSYAHTLKGVSANLSYGRLYEAAADMTEALRGIMDKTVKRHEMEVDLQAAVSLLPRLDHEYQAVIAAIRRLLDTAPSDR